MTNTVEAPRIVNLTRPQPIAIRKWDLLQNARVAVEKLIEEGKKGASNKVHAHIVVNDKYEYTFDHKSRVSRALLTMSAADLAKRFTGGSFFFADGELIDYRDHAYHGFVHDRESIQQMVDLIGFRTMLVRDRRALAVRTYSDRIVPSGVYNKQEIVIPHYLSGGVFTSHLMYNWNPFHKVIHGVFELTREICSNGMIGVSDFMNARIPIINNWEEHMEIAARQIQNKIEGKVSNRLIEMGTERASVGELQLLATHAIARLTQPDDLDEGMTEEERARLSNLYKIVNPVFHLYNRYQAGAFTDSNVARQLPGHLTTFDTFNIATEMYSHTPENKASTGFALQRLANAMMFENNKRVQRLNRRENLTPVLSAFSDPTHAFFGELD